MFMLIKAVTFAGRPNDDASLFVHAGPYAERDEAKDELKSLNDFVDRQQAKGSKHFPRDRYRKLKFYGDKLVFQNYDGDVDMTFNHVVEIVEIRQ